MADRRANRGMRDEAGVGPNPHDARRLIPLKELDDYQVADGEPDVRGWNVYTATGREIGDVDDLLVGQRAVEQGDRLVVEVVERLGRSNMLDCLQLLHFHIGSQISSIIPIKSQLLRLYMA